MKKYITIAALLAVGSVFANADVATTIVQTYSPLASSDGWTLGAGRYTPVQYDNGTLYSSGWNQGYAHYDFASAIALKEGQWLTYSFDLTSNNTNSVATFTFETATKNVVLGSGAYNANIGYGVTESDSGTGYVKSGGWGVQLGDAFEDFSDQTFTATMPYTMSGEVRLVDSNYIMTIALNGTHMAQVDLGTTFALYGVVFSADGEDAVTQGSRLSNLSITINAIPEPSAFGLLAGLGALALVGARRRRR